MMPKNLTADNYERKITTVERLFARSPFSVVTMVVKIKGNVSQSMLTHAVSKVQKRHPNLRSRIREDHNHDLWLTSEGTRKIPVEFVDRESDEHWISVFKQASQVPFEFDVRPAIRFILVQSTDISELIILCHHIICDGLSLAYLARDMMVYLGNPDHEVGALPNPTPICEDAIPNDVSINKIVKFFINRINKKWENDKVFFDQQDYLDLNKAYWMNYRHQMLCSEFSETQTFALVARCKKEEVTVNTALTAAFVGAQCQVPGSRLNHPTVGVFGNLRNRLQPPVGEVMGFFAGGVTLKYKYDSKREFWENARRLHHKLKPLFTNKKLFADVLLWCHLAPGILDAMLFKKLGALVPSNFLKAQKLSDFGKRNDIISSLLKKAQVDSLDRTIMGTAVTNLTNMGFPRTYGSLELDRLIMNPGGAFPLVNVNLVVGAVTCCEKLSLVMEYAEEAVDTPTMERIKDKAMEFLLSV